MKLSSEGNRVSASMRDEAPKPVRSPGRTITPSSVGVRLWRMAHEGVWRFHLGTKADDTDR